MEIEVGNLLRMDLRDVRGEGVGVFYWESARIEVALEVKDFEREEFLVGLEIAAGGLDGVLERVRKAEPLVECGGCQELLSPAAPTSPRCVVHDCS